MIVVSFGSTLLYELNICNNKRWLVRLVFNSTDGGYMVSMFLDDDCSQGSRVGIVRVQNHNKGRLNFEFCRYIKLAKK